MLASTTAFVILAGLFDLAFAAFHLTFWRLFGWPTRLRTLDSINRALPQVMNIALIVLFVVLGLGLATSPVDAAESHLGQLLLAGMSVFWLIRAIVQVTYFGLRHWASISLTFLFGCGSILHGLALVSW